MQVEYNRSYDTEYLNGLNGCLTLDALIKHCEEWKWIASDALQRAKDMDEERFAKMLVDAKKERRGIFTNNEDFMVIRMPSALFDISLYARKFNAPWGMVFNILQEADLLRIKDGICYGIDGGKFRNTQPGNCGLKRQVKEGK